MKLKKTYSYALWSAVYLTLLSIAIAVISYFLISKYLGVTTILISVITFFTISFFIIQHRSEHFIYRRLRKIYDEVSILNVDDIKKGLQRQI